MLNAENATAVAWTIGSYIGMESEIEMQRRGYLRLKIEVKVDMPLKSGFWWTDGTGNERWAQIRYERLSYFCYRCGTLGHTAQTCNRDIILSEVTPVQPMYGPWTTCTRQRKQTHGHQIGGGHKPEVQQRNPGRKTWKDLMKESGGETNGRAEKDRMPKLEANVQFQDMTIHSGLIEETRTGNLHPEGQAVSSLKTALMPYLDLNLSLVPTCQRKGGIYLNLEPQDDDQPILEDPKQSNHTSPYFSTSQVPEGQPISTPTKPDLPLQFEPPISKSRSMVIPGKKGEPPIRQP